MNVEKIFNAICKLSLVDSFQLLNKLKKKFVFKKENTEIKKEKKFSVIIKTIGQSKIMIIKLIKDLTNLDLISSKKLLDKLPCLIKKNLKKSEANDITKKLELLGCTVEIK
ncbi:ribosomal protein L7/L12 [Candidatus Vidania fulgoroideorum]